MSLAEIKEMSAIERVQAMEMLWDNMIFDEKELQSPRWHGAILKKRRQQMESGQSKSIPLSRLKSVLKK